MDGSGRGGGRAAERGLRASGAGSRLHRSRVGSAGRLACASLAPPVRVAFLRCGIGPRRAGWSGRRVTFSSSRPVRGARARLGRPAGRTCTGAATSGTSGGQRHAVSATRSASAGVVGVRRRAWWQGGARSHLLSGGAPVAGQGRLRSAASGRCRRVRRARRHGVTSARAAPGHGADDQAVRTLATVAAVPSELVATPAGIPRTVLAIARGFAAEPRAGCWCGGQFAP